MSSLSQSVYTGLYEEAERSSINTAEALSPLYHSLERVERRYGEGELIGKGGMKEVVKVFDERTERYVALARPKEGVGPDQYDSFLREVRITARLEHPNIITLFDMGIDEARRPFFTMEFKRGRSLRRMISARKKGEVGDFELDTRLSIFLKVCEAMAYAHSRRVLHLDLKPENIQVGTFGEVQVCDWGMGEIERDEDEDQPSVALLDPDLYGDQLDRSVKGTPGYMAPEQFDPKATKTSRTDIFALGCLLYELSTLEPPTRRREIPVPSPALEAIVRKACAEEPTARYVGAEALGADVRRYLLGYSPEVEQAGFFREAWLFYKRNRVPCLISLFFSLLVLGTAIGFARKLGSSYEATSKALAKAETALDETNVARRLAEEALARHKLERAYAVALFDARDATTGAKARFLFHSMMIRESISLAVIENALLQINKEIAANPSESHNLWQLKGQVMFMTQRFDEAEECFAVEEGGCAYLRRLIPEFAPLVRKDGLLPAGDFERLLRKIAMDPNGRFPLVEKMVVYDSLIRMSPETTKRGVRTMLELSNPQWKNPVFEYDPTTKHLRVSGDGLFTLLRSQANSTRNVIPAQCLLRLIVPRTLDLRGSEVSDLMDLEGLELDELDLRDTPVTVLAPLSGMTSLRRLIVSPGQFGEAQLAELRGTVTVEELALPGG